MHWQYLHASLTKFMCSISKVTRLKLMDSCRWPTSFQILWVFVGVFLLPRWSSPSKQENIGRCIRWIWREILPKFKMAMFRTFIIKSSKWSFLTEAYLWIGRNLETIIKKWVFSTSDFLNSRDRVANELVRNSTFGKLWWEDELCFKSDPSGRNPYKDHGGPPFLWT